MIIVAIPTTADVRYAVLLPHRFLKHLTPPRTAPPTRRTHASEQLDQVTIRLGNVPVPWPVVKRATISERRTTSGERRAASHERRTASSQPAGRAANGEQPATSGDGGGSRRAAVSQPRAASGERRAASGERRRRAAGGGAAAAAVSQPRSAAAGGGRRAAVSQPRSAGGGRRSPRRSTERRGGPAPASPSCQRGCDTRPPRGRSRYRASPGILTSPVGAPRWPGPPGARPGRCGRVAARAGAGRPGR